MRPRGAAGQAPGEYGAGTVKADTTLQTAFRLSSLLMVIDYLSWNLVFDPRKSRKMDGLLAMIPFDASCIHWSW